MPANIFRYADIVDFLADHPNSTREEMGVPRSGQAVLDALVMEGVLVVSDDRYSLVEERSVTEA